MFTLARRRPTEVDYELLWGVLGVLLLAAAWSHPYWGSYFSYECPLKVIAGIPCVFCGGTRAAEAWMHGHFAEALAWNPLAAMLIAGLTLYIPYTLLAVLRPDWPRIRFAYPTEGKGNRPWLAFRFGTLLLLALNWIYLFRAGR